MDYLVLTKVHGAILGPISQILGWILNVLVTFTNSFGVLNIGLSIILFTLVVKLLMFPMTIKQQKASKLMAVMQPELQAIQAKYKGKTDNDSMMKMNVETKAVYEKYGTSMTEDVSARDPDADPVCAVSRDLLYSGLRNADQGAFFECGLCTDRKFFRVCPDRGAAANLLQFATDHNIALTVLTRSEI